MTINQIQELIEEATSLNLIAQAYTEISSNRLKRIRLQVERNRQFFKELSDIYQIVKHVAYQKQVTPPEKNNKTINIVITSNYRFYGYLNDVLMQYFIENNRSKPSDSIIIGGTGIELLKGANYSGSFTEVKIAKDLPVFEELSKIISMTKDYSKVLVYYSQMKSVLQQTPQIIDITQSPILTAEELAIMNQNSSLLNLLLHPQSISQNLKQYIFEPDILKMLNFFETQISILLLEQTFLESELSHTAARLTSMDQAQINAKNMIKDSSLQLNLMKDSITDSRLLEMVSALESIRKKKYNNHRYG